MLGPAESRGTVLGRGAALLVRLYQNTLGLILPARCRFHPSCSEYAVRALRANGLIVGLAQSAWRLLRCGPWTAGGFDEPARIDLLKHLRTRQPRAKHG
jgi:putative membrane protein insertion efficiency factor